MEYPTELEFGDCQVSFVPVALLRASGSLPQLGQDREHIDQLLASEAGPPPTLVHSLTMRVIDGMHLLRVAVLRGCQKIKACFFGGSAADSFMLAVQADRAHGLPLSPADPAIAAGRLPESHPQWLNRFVAKLAGLAPGRQQRSGTAQAGCTGSRTCLSAGSRPLDSSQRRQVAYCILTRTPDTLLREDARLSQISVRIVHDVVERLHRGLHW